MASERSQIAARIDWKLCLVDFVFLGKPVQKRRHGASLTAAEHVDFDQ
ncbi:hypothetical protein C481_03042 [Natrialba asiatica DSM 12278]|uniref:Uncharacterized protein n=1 Tax=Natrialba asiatica (strain ATCC 700177 / DSM 12278 / JCM 9576 / FERM P-10747 / NBRC 102637 / 172P1) TaxID=29540 RepID=M0B4R9_NATA1|nr:hypothetical protein C481_03042 [Natrialba asiatica DSM 12278]